MLFPGLLIFLFLIIIRPQDFMPFLYGVPIVFVVMGVLLTAWILSPVEKRLIRTAQDRYYALFFTIIVISSLNAGWLGYTKEVAIETSKIALIYWFCVTIVNDEHRLKIATWTTVTLMTAVAAMGVLQSFGYDITGQGMYWAADKKVWQVKGAGLFDNPNDLAYSIVLVVPFTLGLACSKRNLFTRAWAIAMCMTAVYCIYLTRSRGGYLAVTMGVVIWFYFWISNQNLRRIAVFAGLIGIFIAFSIQTRNYRDDKSSMGRVEAWAAGMKMLGEHPIIGVGKGQFLEHNSLDSHNSYVRAGSELGIVGLFAFLGILFSTFRSLYPATLEGIGPDWKIYRVGFLAYLGSYSVASIFSTRTYDIIFMIAIALTGVMARLTLDNRIAAEVQANPVTEKLINNKVIGLTILTLIIWKLFLIQVW